MSLLSLSKKILGKDKKPARRIGGAAQTDNKKIKSTAKTAQKKKQPVDTQAYASGIIGLTEIISEKSIRQQQLGIGVFRVLPHVTKTQIAQVVASKFGVKVLAVRTSLSHPKIRRRGVTEGRVNKWKKAYVKVDNIQALVNTK